MQQVKSNELMAHAYSKTIWFAVTGLRGISPFMVRGDVQIWLRCCLQGYFLGEPIKVFSNGDMIRDFTYIDDIVEGTIAR